MNLSEQITFFENNRYLMVPAALTKTEVTRVNAAIDSSRELHPALWYNKAPHQFFTVQAMLTEPRFDFLLRHPSLFEVARRVLDEDIAFVEFSARLHGPEVPPEKNNDGWHRDAHPYPQQRLGIRLLSAIFYLTDVERSGHRFSLLPASHNEKKLPATVSPDGLELQGEVQVTGPAGTAILFDGSVWHSPRHGNNGKERRTIHIYYQPTSLPAQTEFTIVPRRLWDTEDPVQRRFYSVFNTLTRAVYEDYTREQAPSHGAIE